ncbi:restriction endonuclease subunit S [Crateriforma conspicua]|uniref:Type-1 restriction enzyme EcoKI specificity protein n=1 Tax=Crateriforma conspicua TaxID=2527996 RepID=A0A5C6G255_9PLAN|nr:restriction endonuclease subunit S [Crateriforma conspicua]TWU67520.1 Type-1 restriction enzyme EcoKI specificity protein [Crateriforma conspicua]
MNRVELTDKDKQNCLLRQGDLLFARRSLTAEGAGKCSIVKEVLEDTTFESSIIRARPDTSRALSDYLYYYFGSYYGKALMRSIMRQVAVAGITGSDLKQLEIPTPPISVQQSIAYILGMLDDKIELNRRMNETLESMARALFKSWFVDFDPVIDNALAAGHCIPEPLAARAETRRALGPARKPLPENIRSLFPATFAFDEEMGWIPEGWNVVNLDECCLFQEGYVNPSQKIAEYFGDEIKWLRAVDLNDGFVFDTTRKISKAGFESAGKAAYLFKPDSIAISKSGTIGRVGILKDFMCGNRAVINVQPRPDKCGTQFIFRVLKFYNRLICELAIGSVQKNLYASALGSQKFVYPNIELVKLFEEESGVLSSRMASNVSQCISLAKLRDTLLPKLLSGELRIPEAEKLVSDSV